PNKNDNTQNNDTKKDKGKNFIDTIDESETKLKYYMDAMDSLYEQYNPNPWFNMDDQGTSFLDEEYDEEHALSIFWNKLILLISAIGLRSSKVSSKAKNHKEIPTKHFTETIKKHSKLIFYGPPECGKTTFLKHYTEKHLKTTFYIDIKSDFSPAQSLDEFILYTVFPDYRFWKEDFSALSSAYGSKFFDPWHDYTEITLKELELIPSDITLIMDNITDFSIVKKYADALSCHIVFVSETVPDDMSISTYEFLSPENIQNIFKDLCDTEFDNNFLTDICSCLGTNLYVYRLTAAYYKKLEKNNLDDGKKFLASLASNKSIEEINREKRDYSSNPTISFSHDVYKAGSSEQTLDKHIRNIYGNYFEDTEQQMLHLLYHCQTLSNDFTMPELYPYLNLNKNSPFIMMLKNLGWLTDDKMHIPKIIVVSVSSLKSFSNKEYSFFLNFMNSFSYVLDGLSQTPIHTKTCELLIRAVNEDFKSYIKEKGKKSGKELDKYFIKETNMSPDERESFRNKGYLDDFYPHEDDPFTDIIFTHWLVIEIFFRSAIQFCIKYSLQPLAKELYTYAAELGNIVYLPKRRTPESEYSWNLQMAVLKYDLFRDLPPTELTDSLSSFLKWEDRKPSDNHAPLYCMHLELMNETALSLARIWKHAIQNEYSSAPELYAEDLNNLNNPFILLTCIKFAMPWYNTTESSKDNIQETSEYLYAILDRCRLLFSCRTLTPSIDEGIESMKNYESQLKRQCNILTLSSLIYHNAFLTADFDAKDKTILELQKTLQEICPSNDNDNLPDSLKKIATFALDYQAIQKKPDNG
ncbi:MAG: hypothetical protein LUE14_00875, partial [Clostridiales bacterium]|nr:hypothetical protein [Clostridiales bacterium]